ncbi:uncharacterized protein LOC128215134 [Mya arenaria]|uniref:uncharacterized protein LOC128215134 n=1 Tax=Mya arenaria TaxID=6604 RepID=UPI0022E687B8|nr:uncharacterized protein LOC128215134 [Mya arenaria]
MAERDEHGRFYKRKSPKKVVKRDKKVLFDHNYTNTFNCDAGDCIKSQCNADGHIDLPQNVDRSGWRIGRRLVEVGFLLEQLQYCCECRLGPLTFDNMVGELKKGLGGYLYVRCQNHDCLAINRVPYGKTHRVKKRGMPCFAANTKLGTAMIDGLGGSSKVNNMLSTLNIKPVHRNNLQAIERRAGSYVENVAAKSTRKAANEAFVSEMKDVAEEESATAMKTMDNYVEYLGVGLLPDSSPSTRTRIEQAWSTAPDDGWTDIDEEHGGIPIRPHRKNTCRRRTHQHIFPIEKSQSRKRLSVLFPCKTRHGMSCAVGTAWQKRGFDSLTCI